MQIIFWIGLFLLLNYILLTGWFFALTYSRTLRDKGIELSSVVVVPLYAFLVAGVIADAIFNATIGSVIFRELPKEWLFTARIRRHLSSSDSRRRTAAERWATRINKIDPGHV